MTIRHTFHPPVGRETSHQNHLILILLYSLVSGLFVTSVLSAAFGSANSPPVFDFKREWVIPANESIGSRIVTVSTRDEDRDRIKYGIERANFFDGSNHFTINSRTGEVFLNESLAEKAGKDLYLYVTANDGHQTAKIEVYVRVVPPAADEDGEGEDRGTLVGPSRSPVSPPRGIPPRGNRPLPPYVNSPFSPINRPRRPISPSSTTGGRSSSSGTRNRVPLSQMSHPLATTSPPPRTNESSSVSVSSSDESDISLPIAVSKNISLAGNPTEVESDGQSVRNTIENLGEPDRVRSSPTSTAIPPSLTANPHGDRPHHGLDLVTAFLPLLAAIAFSPLAGLVFWLLHRKCSHDKRMSIIKSLSHKKVIAHTSDISETSISSISGELDSSSSVLFNKLRAHPKRAIGNRYETSSATISGHFGHHVSSHQLPPTHLRTTPCVSSSSSDTSNSSSSSSSSSSAMDTRWEFPRHRLRFVGILGEGCFGQVWKCEAIPDYREPSHLSADQMVVAVKTLKEEANEKEKLDLLSEIKIMQKVGEHPNVVSMMGCCTEREPLFLIMEFVSRGKLQSYLRECRAENNNTSTTGLGSITSRDLTSFAYQVAKGMSYLSSMGIIHRDLAARNILIDENKVCKIADFGLARNVNADSVYEHKSQGRLPIRWMAIESLFDSIFTTKSDVWSFGVLAWEIVTLGSTPYPGLGGPEVMKRVKDGYRLEKPEHCKREMYNIMFYCWSKDPDDRPPFTELVQMLEKLLVSETEYIELERFPEQPYYNIIANSSEMLEKL